MRNNILENVLYSFQTEKVHKNKNFPNNLLLDRAEV